MARSSITVNQILADARMLAGATDYTRPTNTSMLVKYNLVVNKIFKLLNGAKFRRFMANAPLGSPSGVIFANDTDNRTYTASTKTFTAGTIGSTAVGGLVMWYDATNSKAYCSHVASVTVNTSFVVAAGGSANVTAGNLFYLILLPPTTTSHSIESYRLDELVRALFALAGNAPRVNEDVAESAAANPNYDNVSTITQSGASGNNVVTVKAGSGTTNKGGFPILFFEEKPYKATAVTDSVDLPVEYHSMLVEEIARLLLLERGATVPKALESPLMTIESISETFDATLGVFASSEDKE